MQISWRAFRRVRRRWWVAAVVLCLAAVAATWWWTRDSAAQTPTTTTATASRGDYETTVQASGTITPSREEELSFSSSGEVTAVPVAAGDRVHKGDVLARIDATTLVAQRDAADSALDAAVTQQDEDADAGASATQLAADEAQVTAAKSQLAQAREAVRDATLRSPINGTVSAVDVAVGDQVGGASTPTDDGSDSSGSSAAVTVISTDSFEVDATVGSSDVESLKKGLQATITPTGATEPVYGTVSEVGAIATADSTGVATFPVTIDVTGTPDGLYAGSSADVTIVVAKVTDVLTVPSQALHTDDGETYVYVVDGDDRTRTLVTTGTTYGMNTEIKSGLTEGQTVEVEAFMAPGGADGSGQGPSLSELPDGAVPPDGSGPQLYTGGAPQ
ncbi:MAG TPA: efflux RND transporter periplasmic adaptor subunit [Nocardioides sp.]